MYDPFLPKERTILGFGQYEYDCFKRISLDVVYLCLYQTKKEKNPTSIFIESEKHDTSLVYNKIVSSLSFVNLNIAVDIQFFIRKCFPHESI